MYRVNMSQPQSDILRGLINFDLGKSFAASQVKFNPKGPSWLPHEQQTRTGRNSVVRANFRLGYDAVRYYHYNRINLTEFFGANSASVPYGKFSEFKELIPDINADLGIYITEDDIINEDIDSESMMCYVEVKNTCLAYYGKIPVFFEGAPGSLSARIPTTSLNGFSS